MPDVTVHLYDDINRQETFVLAALRSRICPAFNATDSMTRSLADPIAYDAGRSATSKVVRRIHGRLNYQLTGQFQ